MFARSFVLLALLTLTASVGCARREALGVRAMSLLGPGVINDPKNRSLRFDLLKFGLDQFCQEMRVRGAPLKVRDGEPVVGRFFADDCSSQIIDDASRQSFLVQYRGTGYAWTNVTQRIGFTTAGLLEYAPDFRLHEGAMYVYFRPTQVNASSFQTLLVEGPLAQAGLAATGVDPNEVGRRIVDSQLRRGFTVIRYSAKGETEFGMGYIPVGERPFHPFEIVRSDKITLDNDRTEVHSGQQDMIGGFLVPDDDQALFLTLKLEGAPTIDVFLVRRDSGRQVLNRYVRNSGPAGLDQPPLLDETVPAGSHWKRYVAVPPGEYYLMLDHSAAVGRSAPPQAAGDDRAARVDYVVQLGDAP